MTKRNEIYHYTECGLDNVLLAGGFEICETSYGKGVRIHNMDGLHKAIALDIVRGKAPLTGAELRFLRKELNLSQVQLADLLEITEQSVANYEKGRGKKGIPKPVDVLVRALYLEYVKKDSDVTRMVKRMADLDARKAETRFRFNRGKWSANHGDGKSA